MQGHTEDHAQLVEYMDVQAFSFRSTFQPVCPQPVLVNAGILPIPSPVQNLTFVHADFHEVPVCSSLRTGRIPLNPSLVLYHIHLSPQLVSIHKLAENLL